MSKGLVSAVVRMLSAFGLGLTAAFAFATEPAPSGWKVQPYAAKGDEEQRYKRASDLMMIGQVEDARVIIDELTGQGYPLALRYGITKEWDPAQQKDLSRGCGQDRRGSSFPTILLERLALTGDKEAIRRYWNCMASGANSDRNDRDWRGAYAVMHWLARSGDSTAAGTLFQHYLAGAEWVRTPQNLKRYLDDRRVICRLSCRLPDPAKAAEMAELVGRLEGGSNAALAGGYASAAETVAWYYNASENYPEATKWAAEAARRFAQLDEYSWNRPWASEGNKRMRRLADVTATMIAPESN